MAETVQLTCVTVTPVTNSRLFSVFQSESEQDEECMGSMGSAAVAVSPFSCLFLLFCFYDFVIEKKLIEVTSKAFEQSSLQSSSFFQIFSLGNTHPLSLWGHYCHSSFPLN